MNIRIEKVSINTDSIKLDSFIKFAGMAVTGGQAKGAVQDGAVLVNGEICTMRGKKLYPGDRVTTPDVPDIVFEVVKGEDKQH